MNGDRTGLVAIVGNASLPEGDARLVVAEELGKLLVDHGFVLLTGGMGGVMEAACLGARRSVNWRSGSSIGILPGADPKEASEFLGLAIPTGMGHARNVIVAQADAVVAIGGGAGTLSEIAMAWAHYRLILALRSDGWSGRLADTKIDERNRYPEIENDRVYGFEEPEEAAALIERLLPSYSRRHHGVRRRDE